MPGSVLPDSTAVISLLRGDSNVTGLVGSRAEVFTSVVVVGELLYGARHSSRPEVNLKRVVDFVAAIVALPCDEATAEVYARVKQQLRAKGRPIPDYDLWSAATAIQHELPLLHRDARFEEVEELQSQSWS